jgi:adenylate kinase
MNLVLLGAPGSGKGTQAKALCSALRLTHLSTGSLFREQIEQATPLGLQIRDSIGRGELVPDEVTVAMLRERLRRTDTGEGAVFDGFPRTVAQAEALDVMLWSFGRQLEGVVYIDVPDEEIVDRLAGRMVCRECDAPFHITANPFGACPHGKCHGEFLYRRDDDQPATVRARLEVFHRATQPVIEYYRGRLASIDGRGGVERVNRALFDAVQAWTGAAGAGARQLHQLDAQR